MIYNRCIICGVNFESDDKKLNVCSDECKRRLEQKRYLNGRVFVNCIYCNKEIQTTYYRIRNNHNKCCSKECQYIVASELAKCKGSVYWKNENSVKCTCKICGKEFYESNYRVNVENRGKCCSKECRVEYMKIHAKRGEDAPSYNRVKTICSWCGKEITRSKYQFEHSKKSFCSQKCHGKWFGENCKGENHPVFKNVINYHGYHHTFVQKHNQMRVRKLFNNTCVMCGCSKEDNGADMVVHHVYPEQKTLPFDQAIYVCLCKSCHQKVHHQFGEIEEWTPKFEKIISDLGRCYVSMEEL